MRAAIGRLLPSVIKHRILGLMRDLEGGRATFVTQLLGEHLTLTDADALSRRWYGKSWTAANRTEFQELAEGMIPKDGLVFDIGAHQGVVSILLRRLIVPEGRVVSVEMDRRNHAACIRNAHLNGETSITVVHGAVGASEGTMRHSGRSNAQVVAKSPLAFLLPGTRVVTIDALCARHGMPDLIYLDIEGAEILALQAGETALRSVGTWFVELHGDEECGKFGGSNGTVARAFEVHGYALTFAPFEDAPYAPVTADTLTNGRGFLIAQRPAPA